jgi:hypothetical protein
VVDYTLFVTSVVADIGAEVELSPEVLFYELLRLGCRRAAQDLYAALVEELLRPLAHSAGDHDGHLEAREPCRQYARLMGGRRHKLLASDLAAFAVNVHDGELLAMSEVRRQSAGGQWNRYPHNDSPE